MARRKPIVENGMEIRYVRGSKTPDGKPKKKRKIKIIDEFKAFALRGNVIDLAVGVIIGGAFQKIVTSVVNDLAMPLVGVFTGGVNFNEKFLILSLPDDVTMDQVTSLLRAKELEVTTLNYGAFITALIDFFIMAAVIFLMVKLINRVTSLQKAAQDAPAQPEPEAPADPEEKTCPYCLSEIPAKAVKCRYCASDVTMERKSEDGDDNDE